MTKPVRRSAATVAALLIALVTALVGLAPVATATTAAPAVRAVTSYAGVENVAKEAALEAIDPSQYECGPTLLDDYIDQLIGSMTDEEFFFLIAHIDTIFDVPTYDPLLFGTAGDPTYALTLHATQLTRTFRQVKAFWDIKSDDIQLMAMHPDSLLDADRITATNLVLHDGEIAPADIRAEAEEVAAFMQAHPDFAANPLWTLNAYAFSGVDEDPPFDQIPDKLVFGDGFIQAYDALGLGDVGPRVVMGHEFGHHIQYEDDLFETDLTGAEATRRTELMADTFAAYFGTHKRGLALNKKRVVDTLLTFYTAGDCAFDDDGHHGTPNQRERAAEFGADLAANARPRNVVLPSLTVASLFEDALPTIVAPDAS